MKKTLALLLTLALAALCFAACGKNNGTPENGEVENNQENAADTSAYTLEGIIESIYAQKAPQFMYGSMPVELSDADAVKMFLGLDDASKVSEAVVSESMIGAQAYSLVLARVAQGQDAKAVAEEMKAGIDPRKWICVEADDVKVTTYGDLICFCMIDSEYAEALTAQDVMDSFTNVVTGKADYIEAPSFEEEIAEDEIVEGEIIEDETVEGEVVEDEATEENVPADAVVDNTPTVMPEEEAENNTPAVMPEQSNPEAEQEPTENEEVSGTPVVTTPDEGVIEEEISEEEDFVIEVSELEAIINNIYANKAPQFMLGTMPVDLTDEFSYTTYLGLKDPSKIAEAYVSESMIGAQAYSLVVAKVADGQDAAAVAEEMKAGIDPRKWICVEADDIKTATSGNLVCFCMIDSEYAEDFTAQDAIDGFLAAVAK